MFRLTERGVEKILQQVMLSPGDIPLPESGLITGIQIKDDVVTIVLEAEPERISYLQEIQKVTQNLLEQNRKIKRANVVISAERPPSSPPAPKAPAFPGKAAAGHRPIQGTGKAPQQTDKLGHAHIPHMVAIASGKGGVGKSTTTANLAVALARMGMQVGVLDADIYGPSMPMMFGISTTKPEQGDNGIIPPVAHGVTVMSLGFMLEADTPVVWRGPMVVGALQQLITETDWPALDILLLDLPPGTGDIQLTLCQKADLAGAVIVSTPQDVALLDARKGLNMFRKVDVPVLGIIENMSTHICSNCGHEEHIFGHGGAAQTARDMDTPFLGGIPLHIDVRTAGDDGTPITLKNRDGAHARAYMDIAAKIADALHLAPQKT
jgi:ATP-binding protein involved in chromosome partitioning